MKTRKVNSPVEQFYETLEEERRRAEEEAKKTKRGRPRKNKMYFCLSHLYLLMSVRTPKVQTTKCDKSSVVTTRQITK